MRKKTIKNYNRGAVLQNGLDITSTQGFADTESRYLNADGDFIEIPVNSFQVVSVAGLNNLVQTNEFNRLNLPEKSFTLKQGNLKTPVSQSQVTLFRELELGDGIFSVLSNGIPIEAEYFVGLTGPGSTSDGKDLGFNIFSEAAAPIDDSTDSTNQGTLQEQINVLENQLDRYDSIISDGTIALKAATEELGAALQACDDEVNSDDSACTDAAELNTYVDTLRNDLFEMDRDSILAEDVSTALASAVAGNFTKNPAFTDNINDALSTLSQNTATGVSDSDSVKELEEKLDLIYEDVEQFYNDIVENIDFFNALAPGTIDTVAEVEEKLNTVNTFYSALSLGLEAEENLTESLSADISSIENFLIALNQDTAAGTPINESVQAALNSIAGMQSSINQLSTFQDEIIDLGQGNDAAAIQAVIDGIELANENLTQANTDLEFEVDTLKQAATEQGIEMSELTEAMRLLSINLDEANAEIATLKTSLQAFEDLGTVQAFEDALEDSALLTSVLGLGFTEANLLANVQALQTENESIMTLINNILKEVDGSTNETIVNDLKSMVTALREANDSISALTKQNTELTLANDAQTTLIAELNILIDGFDEDIAFYQTKINEIGVAVGTLGETVDVLEDYLEDNYGYKLRDGEEEGQFDSAII
jgi:hypothetical protein